MLTPDSPTYFKGDHSPSLDHSPPPSKVYITLYNIENKITLFNVLQGNRDLGCYGLLLLS